MLDAERTTRANPAHVVDEIDDFAALADLRGDWQHLHGRDPDADFFTSYRWLEAVFRRYPKLWSVFVVRRADTGALICLFPAQRRSRTDGSRNRLGPAGRLTLCEYNGFICDPEHEVAGLTALAKHLATLDRARFSMRYEPTGRRSEIFAAGFPREEFRMRQQSYTLNDGQTDNLNCPRLALPNDFESYLTTQVGTRSRKNIRRARRLFAETDALRITLATPETLPMDLQTLFALWSAQWSGEYSPKKIATALRRHRRYFQLAAGQGAFFLSLLWHGDTALGAQAIIADAAGGAMYCKMAARADRPDLPIGMLLEAHSIEWAIAQGFNIYDFGHGNEPYKYKYGAVDRPVNYFTITWR